MSNLQKSTYYCLFLIKQHFRAIKAVIQLTQASSLTQMGYKRRAARSTTE